MALNAEVVSVSDEKESE